MPIAGWIGGLIEGLFPNYLATLLPNGEAMGTIVILWAFSTFYLVRWWWRRTANTRARLSWKSRCYLGQAAVVSLVVIGSLTASISVARYFWPHTSGIASLSNKQLLDYTINLANQMRTFETNAELEVSNTRQSLMPRGPIQMADAAERQRIWDENQRRADEIILKTENEFRNTYMYPAREVRDVIETKLSKIGIIRKPQYPIKAFEGKFRGGDAIREAADYIEQIARELYNRGT